MNNPKTKCCFNCKYFSCDASDFTITGRVKKYAGAGQCNFPINWPNPLPASLDYFRPPIKQTVWPDSGLACPCFELSEECQGGGNHVWGTDGQHSNVFCRKCFQSKPENKKDK